MTQYHFADRFDDIFITGLTEVLDAASDPNLISLAGGLPDISLLPLDEVAAAASQVITQDGAAALQYGGTRGRESMRATACELVKDWDIHVTPKDVLLTSGSQQALDLLSMSFINPGDVILTEGPTYLGALQAFSSYGPDIHTIQMDDEGMRMDLLEEELKRLGKGGAKFIYVIPNFQNPSGVTMTLERRKQLIELAAQYEIPIIEDDPYGWLRYSGEALPSLRALSDDVIYLCTISKIFAPGLRLAWIIAPQDVLDHVDLLKQGADLCGSVYDQFLTERYFNQIDWRKNLAAVNVKYEERRDAMLSALEKYMPEGTKWTQPDGGLFLWLTFPEGYNTKEMTPFAIDKGVLYVPGTSCYPDGRGEDSMRLSFSFVEPEKITEGIKRLAEAFEAYAASKEN